MPRWLLATMFTYPPPEGALSAYTRPSVSGRLAPDGSMSPSPLELSGVVPAVRATLAIGVSAPTAGNPPGGAENAKLPIRSTRRPPLDKPGTKNPPGKSSVRRANPDPAADAFTLAAWDEVVMPAAFAPSNSIRPGIAIAWKAELGLNCVPAAPRNCVSETGATASASTVVASPLPAGASRVTLIRTFDSVVPALKYSSYGRLAVTGWTSDCRSVSVPPPAGRSAVIVNRTIAPAGGVVNEEFRVQVAR